MADASHHGSPDVVHYSTSDEQPKYHGASLALIIVCIVLAAAAGFLAYKLREQTTTTADLRAQLEQSHSEITATKADLAKAGAGLADLHAQLDKANTQQNDLEAQVKKAEQAEMDLEVQLQKAHADLLATQQKAQSQAAELQGQLRQARDSSAALQNQLAQARSQSDAMKAQLARAREDMARLQQPASTTTRTLPLTSEFKKSLWGGTFTLELKNPSPDPLKVDLDITGSPNTPSKSVTIEGGKTFKLGNLAPGAKIAIASDGYSPISLTAK